MEHVDSATVRRYKRFRFRYHSRFPSNHNNIDITCHVLMKPKALSNLPLELIPNDRVPNLLCDDDPESRVSRLTWHGYKYKIAGHDLSSLPQGVFDFTTLPQAEALPKCSQSLSRCIFSHPTISGRC